MSHGTVETLVKEGAIVPRRRTTVDDLEWAATWLEAYEGNPADDRDGLTAMATVAAALRRHATQRRRAAKHRADSN